MTATLSLPAATTFTPLPELAECKRDLDWLARQLDGMKWADLGAMLERLRPDDEKYVNEAAFKSAVRAARQEWNDFTADELMKMAAELRAKYNPPIIGITTRPDMTALINRTARATLCSKDYGSVPLLPEFYGIPVYEKADQDAPWKVWYDEAAMREYLKESEETK